MDKVREHAASTSEMKAIDLFCGAGGLSYGLHLAGFEVILAAEKESEAAETHRAHLPGATICEDLSEQATIDAICEALDGTELDLVAGGPPCQPYSQAAFSKVRHLERFHGRKDDERRSLWSRFLEVVERLGPKAVLVENVPEMAFGRDGIVLRKLVSNLEGLGYQVHTRILCSEAFGVPQHRQRLFVVAFREPRAFEWPSWDHKFYRVLEDAIGDLPQIEGGDKQEVRAYNAVPTRLQRFFRESVTGDNQNSIHDHHARAVRLDDLEAFKLMDSNTKYSDLPEDLKRYRDDIFEDKYKRLDGKKLSRTITAHISQDGYWYIHPTQHRTLSIREAARIQTFPDSFRFCGYPRHALKQIGEAVPPLLAKAVGDSIVRALRYEASAEGYVTTSQIVDAAEGWLRTQLPLSLRYPWLSAKSHWHRLVGFILFERASQRLARDHYEDTVLRWTTPDKLVGSPEDIGFAESRFKADPFFVLCKLAEKLAAGEALSINMLVSAGVSERHGHRILGSCGLASRRPVNASLERMASRMLAFRAQEEDGRGSYEMLVGRLTGTDQSGKAYSALQEIAVQFCTPKAPGCHRCPLAHLCKNAIGDHAFTPHFTKEANALICALMLEPEVTTGSAS